MNERTGKSASGKKAAPAKGKGGLIVVIVLVLLVGFAIAVVAFDLFNFREGAVMSYLRNAPIIGNLMPAAAEEENGELPLEQWTVAQLAARVRELEDQVARLEEEQEALIANARAQALRIARLLPFYEHWSEYQRVSAEFNAMIVQGDPGGFLDFMQYILPEFHEQLMRDAVLQFHYDESIMSIVRTLGAMQERQAAAILEDLRMTDILLLSGLLNAMGNTMRGEILEQMDADIASFMIRLVSVSEPTWTVLAPALFTPDMPEFYGDLYTPDEEEPEETVIAEPPPAILDETEEDDDGVDNEDDAVDDDATANDEDDE